MFVRTLIGRNAGSVVEIEHLAAVQMLKDGRAQLPDAPDNDTLPNGAQFLAAQPESARDSAPSVQPKQSKRGRRQK